MPSLDLGKVVGDQGEPGPVAQGTMMETTYDPQGKAQDVFAYADAAAEAAEKSAAADAEKKANEAKDASAPITHAAQHAYGGSDPITPAAIGAAPAEEHHTKTYTALPQLGLTVGSETLLDIAAAMPDGSRLTLTVGGSNAAVYPVQYGLLIVDRSSVERVSFQFDSKVSPTTQWFGLAFESSRVWHWTGWQQLYDSANKPTAQDVGAATTAMYSATVTGTWTASGDYFYQDIVVSGLLATDSPIVDINPGSDNAANLVYADCIGKVFRVTASANSLRLWATEAIATAFPIQLKVVR